jgi:signal transduction histidine kinase
MARLRSEIRNPNSQIDMPLTVERKLPLIFFFVVIVITVLGFVLYEYTASLQDTVELEKRTKNTVGILDGTLRLTLDVESAINSFIITGNDTYLDPYLRAKVRIPQELAQLKVLTSKSAEESEEVARLEGWTTEYLNQASAKIDRRKTEGFDATISTLGDSSERSVTANIRASIDRLKAAESSALQTSEKSLDNSFNITILVLIIGCVAGAIALGFANVVVSREIGKRRTAETALRDANKDLETRIDERTQELERVNDSLRSVAVEREVLLKNEQSARREAEIATRLRDEFMATVSHELKTPLNSILGWARMLKAGDLDESQVKKALSTIIKNSETQNRLIEDLLDVARIISGKLVLESEPVDPTELVRDAIESATPQAQAKGIVITHHTSEGAERRVVEGDRDRLMQVFNNLLTNAIKFTPDGGAIDVLVTPDDSDLRFCVKDNGIGISPEFLPLVFERFRQDSSSTSRNGGLGLGLAIVRHLVEMHGGSVRVESEGNGKGSEFIVTLPARQREDHQQAHRA